MMAKARKKAAVLGFRASTSTPSFTVDAAGNSAAAFHAPARRGLVAYSTAAFEAYWGDDRDIAREEVLADIGLGKQLPAVVARRLLKRAEGAPEAKGPHPMRSAEVIAARATAPEQGAFIDREA